MNEKLDTRLPMRDVFELTQKAILSLAAGCYVIGLLIVNIWLGKCGVYSNVLPHAEYVLAGAAFIALVLVVGLTWEGIIINFRYVFSLWKKGYRFKSIGWGTVMAPAIYFVPTQLLSILSTGRLGPGNWRTLIAVLVLVFAYWVFHQSLLNVSGLWRRIQTQGGWNRELFASFDYLGTVAFPGILSVVSLYALYVYPHLSLEFGGWRKDPAILVFSATGREQNRNMGLPIQPDNSVGPVVILTESDKDFTVARIDDASVVGPTVRIRRDLVDVVRTQRNESPASTPSAKPAHSLETKGSSDGTSSPTLKPLPNR
jgi:hypothetical protein